MCNVGVSKLVLYLASFQNGAVCWVCGALPNQSSMLMCLNRLMVYQCFFQVRRTLIMMRSTTP